MLNSYLVDAITRQQTTVEQLKTTDTVGAVLTLTRTAIQALTTAGTLLVWQDELRNYQFTWAGNNINIPESGWYIFHLSGQTSINLNDLYLSFIVNGLNTIQTAGGIGDVDRNRFSFTIMRYFEKDDIVGINLIPTANCNLVLNAEGGPGESPILNVVQLSGPVGV